MTPLLVPKFGTSRPFDGLLSDLHQIDGVGDQQGRPAISTSLSLAGPQGSVGRRLPRCNVVRLSAMGLATTCVQLRGSADNMSIMFLLLFLSLIRVLRF